MANVYFLSESSKTRKCWNIRDIAAKADAGLVSHFICSCVDMHVVLTLLVGNTLTR